MQCASLHIHRLIVGQPHVRALLEYRVHRLNFDQSPQIFGDARWIDPAAVGQQQPLLAAQIGIARGE